MIDAKHGDLHSYLSIDTKYVVLSKQDTKQLND